MSVFDVPETLTERLRDDARILNKRDRTEAAARIEELEKRATYEQTLEAAREYVRDTEALYARIAALEEALRKAPTPHIVMDHEADPDALNRWNSGADGYVAWHMRANALLDRQVAQSEKREV